MTDATALTQNGAEQLKSAIDRLQALEAGNDKPVQKAQKREKAITDGLMAMAAMCGITLKPTRINTNGEFNIFVTAELDAPVESCGPYGETFAEYLTRFRGRTGAFGPAKLARYDGWCYLNHFDAEKMIVAFANEAMVPGE